MSSSGSYDQVVGGGLKLKGAGIKKKKKRRSEGEAAHAVVPAAEPSSSADPVPQQSSRPAGRYTATELRRLEVLDKRKSEQAAEGKLKSHRDKVHDFNKYLTGLTEHYDLPKVSKGN